MAGATSTTYGINLPLNHQWVNLEDQYGNPELINTGRSDVVVYTDHCIQFPDKIGKTKIGWLLEPEEYFPWSYAWVRENYKEMDYIFTWKKELLSIDSRFIFLKPGNSWIRRADAQIYPKTKLCSMIASDKDFMEGHQLRRNIFARYQDRFDRYGKDTVPLDYVLPAYQDYMFTVAVENVKEDYMFSEKLVCALLTGTVPIYWGCPSLSNFFDMRGIITFDTSNQVRGILDSITPEKYNEMLPYIQKNYYLAKKYELIDDSLYEKLVEMKLIK